MVRGFYAAGAGMVANSRKLDITGDNIANTRMSGYKKDKAVSSAFQQRLVMKLDGTALQPSMQIGSISQGQTIDSVFTDFEQGVLTHTGGVFDLAISGEGFFSVLGEQGTLYTRNGEFYLDDNGLITNISGGLLLGQNGPINTGGSHFEVTPAGEVFVNGEMIDILEIFNPVNMDALVKHEQGMFALVGNAGQREFSGSVCQGYLEASNANMVEEMMDMLVSQRSFQSCSQVAKMIDATLQKATELGRMNA